MVGICFTHQGVGEKHVPSAFLEALVFFLGPPEPPELYSAVLVDLDEDGGVFRDEAAAILEMSGNPGTNSGASGESCEFPAPWFADFF